MDQVSAQKYAKTKKWAKQITITGTAQIIVQAVGFLSGILVIRLLPVEQYAYYTIANTVLGTMTILSDGGISAGVMAQGAKVWQDKEKLGGVLTTGLHLRKRFAWAALVVSIPILCFLLWKQGADWITCLLLTASLIPAFFAALSDNILQIVPKLHQSITPLQKNQVSVGIGRLLLSGLTLFAFPWAFVAILASGIPRLWGNIKLKKIADPYIDKYAIIDKSVQTNIIELVKRILPISMYTSISNQITLWIISIFGNTIIIAQLGVLSRLAVLFLLFETILQTLYVPYVIKLSKKKEIIFSFIMLWAITAIILGVSIFLTIIFSDFIIKTLGEKYSALKNLLAIQAALSCLGLFSRTIAALNAAKSWVIKPSIFITTNIFVISTVLYAIDLSELKHVLYFNMLIIASTILINTFYFFSKTKTIYSS